ncbi:MAG TPA: metalloregulator ArsR/SmtB family transcription factor [Acidobacteriaceae bacterium]|nr:metalloregulator ArsR/SmtB family transcription factor [Acidobacteriaceae bacterium]
MNSAERQARVFAALGDETRLELLARLSAGEQQSISELTERTGGITRQAVTKHLRVLERAGLVRCTQSGRERRFSFRPEPVNEMQDYLAFVSQKWDEALGRLKAFVEEDEH